MATSIRSKAKTLCLAIWCIFFVTVSGVSAQKVKSTYWDHNDSVVSLDVDGDKRTFSYKEPRPGIVKAGAQPGSLVFEGKSVGGRYVGRAYFYNPRCGRYPYQVEGPILNDGSKVVLKGRSPRFNRRCAVKGTRSQSWTFTLIEPASMTGLTTQEKMEQFGWDIPDEAVAYHTGPVNANFRGTWMLSQDTDEPQSNQTCSNEWPGIMDMFTVHANGIKGYEWECKIKSTDEQTRTKLVEVQSSCRETTDTWDSEGVWVIKVIQGVEHLVMTNHQSNWKREGEPTSGAKVNTLLARRCTDYEFPD